MPRASTSSSSFTRESIPPSRSRSLRCVLGSWPIETQACVHPPPYPACLTQTPKCTLQQLCRMTVSDTSERPPAVHAQSDTHALHSSIKFEASIPRNFSPPHTVQSSDLRLVELSYPDTRSCPPRPRRHRWGGATPSRSPHGTTHQAPRQAQPPRALPNTSYPNACVQQWNSP